MWIIAIKWLKDHWRIALDVLVLVVLLALVTTIRGWYLDSRSVPALKAEVLREKKKREEERAGWEAALKVAHDASRGYQDELDQIRNTPVPVNTVVRVCRPARVPAPTAGAAGPSSPAPGAGVLPETLDLDTRPLFDDAKRCDELSAQVRGLLELPK